MFCSRRYRERFYFFFFHTSVLVSLFCVIDPNFNAISSATNLLDPLSNQYNIEER